MTSFLAVTCCRAGFYFILYILKISVILKMIPKFKFEKGDEKIVSKTYHAAKGMCATSVYCIL